MKPTEEATIYIRLRMHIFLPESDHKRSRYTQAGTEAFALVLRAFRSQKNELNHQDIHYKTA